MHKCFMTAGNELQMTTTQHERHAFVFGSPTKFATAICQLCWGGLRSNEGAGRTLGRTTFLNTATHEELLEYNHSCGAGRGVRPK